MINVGLTAVADHPDLASGRTSSLADLATTFPVVELDTTYYQVPSDQVVSHWLQQVPSSFQFVVKATAAMSAHKVEDPYDAGAEFTGLKRALAPMQATGQLAAVLFQLPPYFGVSAANIRVLNRIRTLYPELPVALEFRNAGWYLPEYRDQTLALMRELNLIHVVVDEPQTPAGSVPLVAAATNSELSIMRLHGRNVAGWQRGGAKWRSERTNYRYTQEELQALGQIAKQLAKQSKQVIVIFNNNGHHDASPNAQQFIKLLGLHYQGLGPQQLDLF
ncbi:MULTISPECIES: DUF72 domain-containing protein [unclassified Lacticaseibacillus]|uniref:DUF72 domain-containing protein n=1 Tax=unclassified Lacticaseibacillus TaxID=2759744 RepID=UPI001941E23D|nr:MULTISPECIES: DUF72 domain-containing protein [unclassified Lacticaseibacillus]